MTLTVGKEVDFLLQISKKFSNIFIEKKIALRGPTQFKPVLLKNQLCFTYHSATQSFIEAFLSIKPAGRMTFLKQWMAQLLLFAKLALEEFTVS